MKNNAVFFFFFDGNFLYRSDVTDRWEILKCLSGDFYEEEVEFWRQNSPCEIERIFAPDSCSDGYALIAIGDYNELKNRFIGWGIQEK